MATKFPIQINNLRFYVNPTGLNVTKGVSFAPLNTQNGVVFQVWYDVPEVLTITGQSAGNDAYKELAMIKRDFEKTNKLSELFYKTRLYKGFITSVNFDHNTSHPERFNYTITFQLLQGEQFAIEDFTIKERSLGTRVEKFIQENLNKPIAKFENNMDRFFKKL
jgi:hypothetical protein